MYSNCKVDAYCIQPWSSSSKSLDWKANLGVGSGGQNNGNPAENVEENVERLLLLWISKFQI